MRAKTTRQRMMNGVMFVPLWHVATLAGTWECGWWFNHALASVATLLAIGDDLELDLVDERRALIDKDRERLIAPQLFFREFVKCL